MSTKSEIQSNPIKPTGGHGGKREGAGRKRGVPNRVTQEIGAAAREFSQTALDTLVSICETGQSESARVQAASLLLDRAYGKPKQALEHAGANGGAIEVKAQVDQFLEKIDAIARRQKEFADHFESEGSKSRGW